MKFNPADIHLTYDDVLLVPQYSEIATRDDVSLKSGMLELELPIISANMDTITEENMAIAMHKCGGAGIIHRFLTVKRFDQIIVRCKSAGIKPIISLGINDGDLDILKIAIERNVERFNIDVAHAHHCSVIDLIKYIWALRVKSENTVIIAGNVATANGALDLARAGANIIKVGIGPGSHCTTRIVTGHGVPQLSAIMNVREALDNEFPDVEIIADGGIRNSGDMAKAFAAGATYVMVGKQVAGCDETPGDIFYKNGQKYKLYRGMASFSAQKSRGKNRMPEGVASHVRCIGPVEPIMKRFSDGLKSACSYSGALTLAELRERAHFIRVTHNSYLENGAHGAGK